MGKGLALEFKNKFPVMFQKYKEHCDNKLLTIGKLWLYSSPATSILCFPTKEHYNGKSKIEFIEKGLIKFKDTYKDKGIESIAFPLLGCGEGGMDERKVIDLIVEKLTDCSDIRIDINSNYFYE